MAKTNKADMSCARVKQYTAFDVSKAERHNERKNETYENMNVITERIALNVHFKKPTVPTYMEQLKQMETDGLVSLRGLRKDATLFNEIVIDVNTMYFERNGGYEYAKQFYEEAYHFIEEKFGADNVISAVMHADEINVAATEELGKEVYHYHLHAMVLPVVEKEILWSKRGFTMELYFEAREYKVRLKGELCAPPMCRRRKRQNTQRTRMSIMPRSTPPTEWKAALTVSRTKRPTSLISRGARDWKKRNGMCPKQRTVFKSFVKSGRLSR